MAKALQPETETLWTPKEIAAYLKVSERLIPSLEAQGTIPPACLAIPRGRSGRLFKRWRRDDVLAHLERFQRH